ncbi:YncE family protein [Erythrobacteraceae bacterium CFH 75059]|nr:YncE family protein [Erythrobacteraceae bacterium CFH 75059]
MGAGMLSLCLVLASGCAATSGGGPAGAGVPSGVLFVANKRGNSLSRIDLATGQETRRVDACANPHELATSPDGRHVALACYGGTRVDVFRTGDLHRVRSIDLGPGARPHGIVWHAGGDLFVTAEGRRSVFRIADPLGTAALTEFATGKDGSHMLAVAPDARTAWTTDLGSRTVTRIDLAGGRAPLSAVVGEEPEGIVLAPDGQTLWVSARRSDRAFALDPATLDVRHEVATGAFPLRIAIRPQGDVAVTSDLASGTLTVIDTARARAVRTITVSGSREPFQVTILWSPDGRFVYVAETNADAVAEVEFATGAVRRRISAGEGGDGLAIIADTRSR